MPVVLASPLGDKLREAVLIYGRIANHLLLVHPCHMTVPGSGHQRTYRDGVVVFLPFGVTVERRAAGHHLLAHEIEFPAPRALRTQDVVADHRAQKLRVVQAPAVGQSIPRRRQAVAPRQIECVLVDQEVSLHAGPRLSLRIQVPR